MKHLLSFCGTITLFFVFSVVSIVTCPNDFAAQSKLNPDFSPTGRVTYHAVTKDSRKIVNSDVISVQSKDNKTKFTKENIEIKLEKFNFVLEKSHKN